MVIKKILIPLLLWLLTGTLLASEQPCTLYGIYEITNIERYQGGLTTEGAAKQFLGIRVSIQENRFSFPGWHSNASFIEAPRYVLRDIPVSQTEGEVPPRHERWGNFYGHGMDRAVIRLLEVYESETHHPLFTFERVDGRLWLFGDGWLYTLERIQP